MSSAFTGIKYENMIIYNSNISLKKKNSLKKEDKTKQNNFQFWHT